MRQEYDFNKGKRGPVISSPVKARYGLIGHPVAHSRSPEIHRAFAEQTGIALDYGLIDAMPSDFSDCVREFFAAGGRGLNITVPHKTAAFELADEIGSEAARASVANVLTRLADGRLRADNSDGIGFVRDLTRNHGFRLTGRRVLIAGAGGAAAGIIPFLLEADVREIMIVNRTPAHADALVARLNDRRFSAATPDTLSNSDAFNLAINATSASLQGRRPTLPEAVIGPRTLAYDLVYADRATPFTEWAAALGAEAADGWGMLVEQAAESFFLWHGVRPDTAALHRRD